jgi:hypothetical protein
MKKNKMKKLLLLLLFIPLMSIGQTWKVEFKNDAFTGKSSVAYGVGYDGDYPYNNPIICFKETQKNGISAFVTRVGGLNCDNPTLTFAFNGKYDDKLTINLYPSNDNDYGYFDESDYFLMNNLIEKLKTSSFAEVLMNTDCSSNRFKIKLDGSTKAINSVIKDYFSSKVKKDEELKKSVEPEYKEWRNYLNSLLLEMYENYTFKVKLTDYNYDFWSSNNDGDLSFDKFQELVFDNIISYHKTPFDYFIKKKDDDFFVNRLYLEKNLYSKYSIYGQVDALDSGYLIISDNELEITPSAVLKDSIN